MKGHIVIDIVPMIEKLRVRSGDVVVIRHKNISAREAIAWKSALLKMRNFQGVEFVIINDGIEMEKMPPSELRYLRDKINYILRTRGEA